ncbi:MAG: hypothetical protein QM775_33160 [Pirellulales bacterium]
MTPGGRRCVCGTGSRNVSNSSGANMAWKRSTPPTLTAPSVSPW